METSSLKQHYESQSTELLLEIAKGDLTDIAKKTLREVLTKRGVKDDEVEFSINKGGQTIKESLDLEQNRGSLGKRFLAQLIDIFGAATMLFIVTLPFSLISEDFHKNLIAFIFCTYFLIRDSIPGQSLGKRMLKLKVIQVKSDKPCSWEESTIRNFFLIFGIFDLVFAFGSNRRRLGDVVAGTMVVSTAKPIPNPAFKRDA